MYETPFGRVREAVKRNIEQVLREAGVKHVKQGDSYRLRGEWNSGFICPTGCGDKSGSASITREGFLKCHQCQTHKDIFAWLALKRGTDEWTVCKDLGNLLNVNMKTRKPPSGRSMPRRMTHETLSSCVQELLESDQAAQARDFLAERKLWHPAALAELGIGYLRGYIVFGQFSARGDVLERYRGYQPGASQPWRWFGSGSGGPGLWPAKLAPKEGMTVVLFEGEWDVLTALIRLRFRQEGYAPCTFTSGAGSAPQPSELPKWLRSQKVIVAYDNDTFQGPDFEAYEAVSKNGQKKENVVRGMRARYRNLTERVAPMLEDLGNEVEIARCPIPALQKWGADLRDWVDGGGTDFEADWTRWPARRVKIVQEPVEDAAFDEAFAMLGRRVRTRVQAASISEDSYIIPVVSKLKCAMGQSAACANCPAVRLWPDQVIDMSPYKRETAVAMHPDSPPGYLLKAIVQPPRGCPGAELVPEEVTHGSCWEAVRPDHDIGGAATSTTRCFVAVSETPPSLTGEMEVTGTMFDAPRNRVFMLVDSVRSIDSTDIDLQQYDQQLRYLTPYNATRVEEIETYLRKRWRDLAYNVHKIHGRQDIQIACDILMHSALELKIKRGNPTRGWIDCVVFGDTRSGKSATFSELFKHYGLGTIKTCVANISRAGIALGTDRDGKLRPGLFPRCDGKALALDEWQYTNRFGMKEPPGDWIQSARGDGYLSSAKISGPRSLPARVRFAAIANWCGGSRNTTRFFCHHLLGYYGRPESVARIDFALAVSERPTQSSLDEVNHEWTSELCRALVLRAWSQGADNVHLEDDAVQHALDIVEEWTGVYDDVEIPLFTTEEKVESILRIATSVANLCYSFHPQALQDTVVRKVHVQWAVQWLEHTYRSVQYDQHSEAIRRQNTIIKPLEAERHLMKHVASSGNIEGAPIILSSLLETFTIHDIQGFFGVDIQNAASWLHKALGLSLIRQYNEGGGPTAKKVFRLTTDGRKTVEKLCLMAEEDPVQFDRRQALLDQWSTGTPKPTITPIMELDDGDIGPEDPGELPQIPL